MSTGIISARYATALLKLVDETGRGRQVYDQVQVMLNDPATVPESLEADLEKFLLLLARNGRMAYLKYILTSFSRMYRDKYGIKLAHLTTVIPAPELEKRLHEIVRSEGYELVLETGTDSSLIGGFVFTVDDLLLDASARRQIEDIRKQFVEKNNRII